MNGTLHLVLTHHWFDEIAAGRKKVEYRKHSALWRKRIIQAQPRTVVFHRAYTRKTLAATVVRIDIGPCHYEGWPGDYIRIHFELKR
jgi:ASC-1-like (ASCH) protein